MAAEVHAIDFVLVVLLVCLVVKALRVDAAGPP